MIINPMYSSYKKCNRAILTNLVYDNTNYETIIPKTSTIRSSLINFEWYHKSLNNKQCQDLLLNKGQGAFIVTNYKENNNYFMIIKYNNKLVKQDIVYDNRLGYYIYGVINPIYFKRLPELVEYYSEPRREFNFQLVIHN